MTVNLSELFCLIAGERTAARPKTSGTKAIVEQETGSAKVFKLSPPAGNRTGGAPPKCFSQSFVIDYFFIHI